MKVLTITIARFMPVWIVVFASWAIHSPEIFRGFGAASSPALGFVLFIMGLTLDRTRLQTLIHNPKTPLLGSLGKWVIATLVSIAVGFLFFGFSQLFYGILMAGIVPSGTSANLNSLIGKGDVALSVTMSAVDTLIGPLLTPALAKWMIGSSVHLDYFTFLSQMMQIVFLPLLGGILLQYWLPRLNVIITPYASILSALSLYIVVLGISAGASGPLLTHAAILPSVFLCVCIQILLQMGLGYAYAKLIRLTETECRSMLFEVGICNTALSTVLANDAFGPLAGLASMANMVCNLTLGSLMAVILAGIPLRLKSDRLHSFSQ